MEESSAVKKPKEIMRALIAVLSVLGYFGVLAALFMGSVPDALGKDVVLVLIGILQTIVTTIVAYYFGSSNGSQKKDEIIASKVSKF